MTTHSETDAYFMKLALEQAELAFQADEVPIGAILVDENGLVCGRGYNCPISLNDPTAHAEIMAIRDAAHFLKNYRLTGLTLYVTLEPCIMCFGAMVHSRISRLVFGTLDKRSGVTRRLSFVNEMNLNHSFSIDGPILERECGSILTEFFRNKR
ncbi:MAG: tRNA-specific adenosine deaminase [Acidobacteria bacterium]|nr:MAG: tRNA-specific adenosine deaminase [Acidobacteriota bacterium]